VGEERFLIERVRALQVLDSRGSPTVKVYVQTRGGSRGWAIAPSGASRGEREAVELRDGGKRWAGRGVKLAVARVNEVVAPRLVGVDSRLQGYVDRILVELDGTPNKSRLGGNATTAVSLAVARAAAAESGLELYEYLGGPRARTLPIPLMNLINGGVHAGNELDFQEFLIAPHGAPSFEEAVRWAVEIYYELKGMLAERYGKQAVNVGDEGGFAPPMRSAGEALEALARAVESAGYKLGSQVALGIDAAASQLYREGYYRVEGRSLSREGLLRLYEDLASSYPIVYLEDPFHEDDVDGFRGALEAFRGRAIVVGDDFLVTNRRLVEERGGHAATGLLVKVNQAGTLTEAIEAAEAARDRGMAVIVSHRSGDSEDSFIADLSVALGALMIKSGAPARSERTAKYNRLLEIEARLGPAAEYSGARLRAYVKV
jgi:enolase